jgi:hypothetical protein
MSQLGKSRGLTTLAPMPGRLREAVLAAVIASVLAGCGSDDEEGTIPPESSESMIAQLDAVEQSVASGDCDEATSRAEDLSDLVNDLPADVGIETKEALRGAAANLASLTADPAQCQPSGATGETGVEPTTEETEPTTTTTTETKTTDEETPTTDEGPDDEEQPPEEQQPTQEEPPPTDQGSGSGSGSGQPPSGGLGPGGEGEGR